MHTRIRNTQMTEEQLIHTPLTYWLPIVRGTFGGTVPKMIPYATRGNAIFKIQHSYMTETNKLRYSILLWYLSLGTIHF